MFSLVFAKFCYGCKCSYGPYFVKYGPSDQCKNCSFSQKILCCLESFGSDRRQIRSCRPASVLVRGSGIAVYEINKKAPTFWIVLDSVLAQSRIELASNSKPLDPVARLFLVPSSHVFRVCIQYLKLTSLISINNEVRSWL